MAGGVEAAARAVGRGRPIVYPTDTLWGLGVRPDDPQGVRRLYALKGRPDGMPVSVAFSSYEELEPWVQLTPMVRATLRHYLPGPFTFLVRASPRARRDWVASVLGQAHTVGVRIPDHPVARRLLAHTGPLTTTSANRHGEPPCRSLAEARQVFGKGVGAYVPAGTPPAGRPSTIVALTGPHPRIIRRS